LAVEWQYISSVAFYSPSVNSIPDALSPPNSKPEAVALRPASRDEASQGGGYLPPRGGLPDKSPVNGTEAPPKALGAPTPASYNRYVPKPYTSTARPFERKFDSPKFNHNLLPNDKPDPAPKVRPDGRPQALTLVSYWRQRCLSSQGRLRAVADEQNKNN